MCLDTIDKKTKEFKYGWKIFKEQRGRVFGQYSTKRGFITSGYPKNKWIKDVKNGKILGGHALYKRGFHFYKYKEDAEKYKYSREKVYRIKIKNVAASGTQFNAVVGVTKEMMILDEVE